MNNKPNLGHILEVTSIAFLIISCVVALVTIMVWCSLYGNYDSELSASVVFGYFIMSVMSALASLALWGFSYVVEASILFLDKNGFFKKNK